MGTRESEDCLFLFLLLLLSAGLQGADPEVMRAAWDADPELARYVQAKRDLSAIEARPGPRGDAFEIAHQRLDDLQNALCLGGKLVQVNAKIARGAHEKELALAPFAGIYLLRTWDFTWLVPVEPERNDEVGFLVPPALASDYLDLIGNFVRTGTVAATPAVARPATDPDLVAYAHLKETYRYIHYAPEMSLTDKRPPTPATAEDQDRVWQVRDRLVKDGRLVQVVAELPLGRCRGDYDAVSLRRLGIEVGWDWDETDASGSNYPCTSVTVYATPGQVAATIHPFYAQEGVTLP